MLSFFTLLHRVRFITS